MGLKLKLGYFSKEYNEHERDDTPQKSLKTQNLFGFLWQNDKCTYIDPAKKIKVCNSWENRLFNQIFHR